MTVKLTDAYQILLCTITGRRGVQLIYNCIYNHNQITISMTEFIVVLSPQIFLVLLVLHISKIIDYLVLPGSIPEENSCEF